MIHYNFVTYALNCADLSHAETHTDQVLLALLVRNDRNAFTVLYRRYWPTLYEAAWKRLKNAQQAEDIVQEIFITLWTRRAALKIDNLPAYLHTAVRFRVLNYVERDLANAAFYEPFEAITASVSNADDLLIEKELTSLVNTYIESLPEKRRAIFILHLKERLSTKEIADRLQVSQKTVQNQLGTALKGLHTRLAPVLVGITSHLL